MSYRREYTFYFISYIICQIVFSFELKAQLTDEFKVKPKPTWVKNYPLTKLKKEYDIDLVLIQQETQYNHITKEIYQRYFYYLNTIKGLNKIRSFYAEYEPGYQTLTINTVNFHRGKDVVALDNKLHIEVEVDQKQINGVRYDDNGKVRMFFEGAKVGDIIEIAYTEKGGQPDLYGTFNFHYSFYHKALRGKKNIRILRAANKEILYKTLNLDIKPKREKNDTYSSLEFVFENDKKVYHNDTPKWYENKKEIYFFEGKSWKDYVNLNLKNFQLNAIPSKQVICKVRELTKKQNTLEEKINSILNYIQSEIHYLNYGLINPKKPEVVLNQGFGDCKSKSLLTIKMLECLGVRAWPLIVNSEGLDERKLDVYSGQAFDHCVVEYLHKRETFTFDATSEPQRGGIKDKYVSNFRYGLRIKKGQSELTKLIWKSNDSFNLIATVTEEEKWNSLVDYQIEFGGQLANIQNYKYKEEGINAVFKTISDKLYKNPYNFADDFELDYSFKSDSAKSILSVKTKEALTFLDERKLIPYQLYREFKIPSKNELGMFFDLPKIVKTNQLYKIQKLDWIDYVPDTTFLKNDWIDYERKSWIKKDTVYISFKAEAKKKHLESIRYTEVRTTIDSLKKDMTILLGFEDDIIFKSYEPSFIDYLPIIIVVTFIILYIWFFLRRRKKRKRHLKNLNAKISILEKELETKT